MWLNFGLKQQQYLQQILLHIYGSDLACGESSELLKVMRKLVHPNLVNLKDIFLEKNRLMLVMELMQVKTEVTQEGN